MPVVQSIRIYGKPTSGGIGSQYSTNRGVKRKLDKDDVQISFRGTVEYRERLQDEARARRIKVQELIERALTVYLKGSSAAEVAAERAAIAKLAPSGHRIIAVPEQMVEIVEEFIRWYKQETK